MCWQRRRYATFVEGTPALRTRDEQGAIDDARLQDNIAAVVA
jgi:hypothetical protein